MQNLNLVLLERLGQLETEQYRVADAILELQRQRAITDEPDPTKPASADFLSNWSRRGLNLRLPEMTV